MDDNRFDSLALIGGAIATLITMAFHPTGQDLLADFAHVVRVNRAVHALGIAGAIATTYGLWGLTRLLQERRALTDVALVLYGFGAVAVMFAAMASGFIGTDLAAIVLDGGDAARAAYEPVFDYNWLLNQAATRVFVVVSSLAIVCWSVAMWSERAFGRGLSLAGVVIGVAAIVATVSGLRMDIHGFGAIVLGHSGWLIWTGVRLWRR